MSRAFTTTDYRNTVKAMDKIVLLAQEALASHNEALTARHLRGIVHIASLTRSEAAAGVVPEEAKLGPTATYVAQTMSNASALADLLNRASAKLYTVATSAWEYRMLWATTRVANELGAQGWEMVSAVPELDQIVLRDGEGVCYCCAFKRPVGVARPT